jgi:hypothetical protein
VAAPLRGSARVNPRNQAFELDDQQQRSLAVLVFDESGTAAGLAPAPPRSSGPSGIRLRAGGRPGLAPLRWSTLGRCWLGALRLAVDGGVVEPEDAGTRAGGRGVIGRAQPGRGTGVKVEQQPEGPVGSLGVEGVPPAMP